jgi:hypothetical protein
MTLASKPLKQSYSAIEAIFNVARLTPFQGSTASVPGFADPIICTKFGVPLQLHHFLQLIFHRKTLIDFLGQVNVPDASEQRTQFLSSAALFTTVMLAHQRISRQFFQTIDEIYCQLQVRSLSKSATKMLNDSTILRCVWSVLT